MDVAFGNVKPESIEAVYRVLTENNKLTRLAIADATGLSVVTVGKIIDALLSMRVLKQSYSDTVQIGRRSRVISLTKTRYTAIFDFTQRNFSLYLCDLKLNIVQVYRYKYDFEYLIDENTQFFLENAEIFASNFYSKGMCCGCGFLLPGSYSPDSAKIPNTRFPELLQLNVRDIYYSVAEQTDTVLYGDIREFSGTVISDALPEYETAFTIFLDNEDISSCCIRGGDKITPLSFAPFGYTKTGHNQTLTEYLDYHSRPREIARVISECIYEVSRAVPFNYVIIIGNRYKNMNIFSSLVQSELQCIFGLSGEPCPTVSSDLTIECAVKAVARQLRDKWFYKKILCKNI